MRRAIERIDRVNAADPNRLVVAGEARPKELAHAEMMSRWVKRLRPDASEALEVAARAHHIKRWVIPRSSYPSGRRGYLQWRRELHQFHADEAGKILSEVGYEHAFIERVQRLVQKFDLRRDPEVQTLEDALCLVFLETQLGDMRRQHGEEKLLDILQKTLGKMGDKGKELALGLDLDPSDRALLARAVAGN